MPRFRTFLAVALASAAVAGGALIAADAGPDATTGADAPWPDGYRDWTHVKSLVIQEGHPLFDTFGGIHHVYADAGALSVLRDGAAEVYPDGATFVFDLLAATEGEATLGEGDRKLVGVMRKDASTFAATGGWGFTAFAPDRSPLEIDAAQCFACHQAKAGADYVFSEWRP